MAIQFEIDCALMAGLAYQSSRDTINWFPIPSGWAEFSHVPNDAYPTTLSFEASAFQNTSTGEIVIAYAGTAQLTDWVANLTLGTGFSSSQLEQAALYYLQIKQANPTATISFTGHSLGGGLAALMGVMFDERAVTFDQAPFSNSASDGVRDSLESFLNDHGFSDSLLATLAPEFISYGGGGTRTANVTGYFVQDEALQLLQPPLSVLGSQAILTQGSTGMDILGIDLHSQALLSTFLENDAFRIITFRLPELLKMVFDEVLYARDPYDKNNPQRNFLDHLIRHQSGVTGAFAADAMLDRFTADLQKVAQDGGFTLTNTHITNTLVAFAMQMYYENPEAAVAGKTLFSDVSGGIRFDRTDVSASLFDAKGWQLYFQNYLNTLTLEEHRIILQLLPAATDWFIQAGNVSMNATADASKAFMVGGIGADWMVGGSEADLLIGNAGDDTLKGGANSDTLIGGAGFDTYLVAVDDGFDTVLDSDGLGVVKFGTVEAQGSASLSDLTKWKQLGNVWQDQQNGIAYGLVTLGDGSQTLFITDLNGSIVEVNGWSDGELGIELGAGAPPAPPTTSSLIQGDHPGTDQSADAGLQPGYDSLHNLITNYSQTEARQDILYGSTGNDRIQGLSGTDYLAGLTGDDLLEGGLGNDALAGGQGADTLKGEDGNDILLGDHELATVTNSYDYTKNASLIANITHTPDGQGVLIHTYQISIGSTPSPAVGGADIIEGGLGDDIVFAGGGDDQVDGGDGADVVFGDGGRDIIQGDIGNDILVGDNYGAGVPYDDDTLSGGDGNDWLYGTGGNDYLEGGAGNDVLFGDGNGTADEGADVLVGGDGDDSLYGGGENDVLIGGADNDTLRGEDGDDILIGGAGVDTLIGGDGNDTLIDDSATGETANLAGGAGDDLYQLGGAGDINLYDNQGYNSIVLGSGDSLEGATLTLDPDQTGYHIALTNGRALNFQNGFFGTGGSVQDGSGTQVDLEGWASSAVTANLTLQLDDAGGRVYGGAGADTLYGGTGSDALAGHKGNDTLQGGAGNDVYEYNLGDGQDTIIETGGNNDVLRFGEGILPERVRVVRWWSSTELDSLRLELLDENGTVNGYEHIKNYFLLADSTNRVDRIEFADGTVWTDEYIRSVVLKPTEGSDSELGGFAGDDLIDGLGGDDWINGKTGNDVLHGGDGDDDIQGGLGNDTLTGGAGNDRLRGNGVWLNDSYAASNDAGDDVLGGGAGNDLMYGGNGADVYLFGRGDGHDAAIDGGTDGKIDVLRLGAGVLPGYVTIYDSSILVIDGSSTQISFGGIERIEFDNGVGPVWLAADIAANTITTTANAMTGTAGNDTFVVDHSSDTIVEATGGGVDTVLASTRYTLPLNVENITLTGPLNVGATGNALDNILIGNASNNTLDGKDGTDIAYGGQGDDWYANVEQIVEDSGEGIDTWYSPQGGTLPDNVENLYMGKYGPAWVPPGYNGIIYSNGSYASGTAIGNDLDNVLVSPGNGSSYNVLDGRAGADTMIATGFDNAYFYVDNPGDKVIASAAGGIDSVVSSISYTLGEHLEQLYLTGETPIAGYGNNLNNVLYGYVLYGPDNAAANVLTGGLGDDVYYLGVGDRAVELAGEGTDKVVASAPQSMAFTKADLQNVEYFEIKFASTETSLELASLGDYDQIIISSHQVNPIMGLEGNDVLFGRPSQADTLIGGTGDDSYYAEASDVIIENVGEGLDKTLFSSNQGYSTANVMAENVEEAYSIGVGVNIIGNAGNNTIKGDDSGNRLDGGLGADILVGGLGNDTFVIDDDLDKVIEDPGEGIDIVLSSADFNLPDNVENLSLAGTADNNGNGNELDNILSGNSGLNRLDGGAGNDTLNGLAGNDTLNGNAGNDRVNGGAGNDTMVGGTGNDTYVVNVSTDVVTEYANEGIDTVASSVELTLPANVENLTLTGTKAINGAGNALDNKLTGNSAVNTLTGGAGNDRLDGRGGADRLRGGAGNDTYLIGRGYGTDTIVENNSSAGNADIARFLSGVAVDQIWFLKSHNNLEVSVIGTSDKMVIKDWYLGTSFHVEQFQTADDARTLLDSNVQSLVNAMASFAPPAAGQTTLAQDYQDALAGVIAANWQ